MNATNIYKQDFLDILFSNRNKDYGAYALRRSEERRVRNALIGTASIALVIIGGYVLSNQLMAADMDIRKPIVKVDPIELKPIDPDVPVTPPPPPVTTPPPPAVSSVKLVVPLIAPDDLVKAADEVPKLDSIGNKSIGLANVKGDDVNGIDMGDLDKGKVGGDGIVTPPAVDHTTTFTIVEINPSFPGGENALAKYLHDNVNFPRMAAENGISGRIFVQFVVDWEGNIRDVKTVGAVKGGGLEEEATRVVRKMPKWKPGKQNGQNVNVQFNLPINFIIQ